VAQQFKYLHQVQALIHPLLVLNPSELRLLVAVVAVVVSMVQVRQVVAVAAQLRYGFTLVGLLPQQVMPMLLELVALAV
jgi:hypothetical protein